MESIILRGDKISPSTETIRNKIGTVELDYLQWSIKLKNRLDGRRIDYGKKWRLRGQLSKMRKS